jgi:hypothetical protein
MHFEFRSMYKDVDDGNSKSGALFQVCVTEAEIVTGGPHEHMPLRGGTPPGEGPVRQLSGIATSRPLIGRCDLGRRPPKRIPKQNIGAQVFLFDCSNENR